MRFRFGLIRFVAAASIVTGCGAPGGSTGRGEGDSGVGALGGTSWGGGAAGTPGSNGASGGVSGGGSFGGNGGASGSAGTGGSMGGAPGCGALTLCPKGCADLESDVENCGSCGYACTSATPKAVPACNAAKCVEKCPNGMTFCNGGGEAPTVCADTLNDAQNCGGCWKTCISPPICHTESGTCKNGMCSYDASPNGALCGATYDRCVGGACAPLAALCVPTPQYNGVNVFKPGTYTGTWAKSCACSGAKLSYVDQNDKPLEVACYACVASDVQTGELYCLK